MQAPTFGQMALIAPAFIPAILGHIREHVALWYAATVFQTASKELGMDLGDLMSEMDEDRSEAARRDLDKLLAQSSLIALQTGATELKAIPGVIAQAQQVMAQFQQQPPMDPIVAVENRKVDERAKADVARIQLDTQEHADDVALEQAKLATNVQIHQADNVADEQMNNADNLTAEQIALLHQAGRAPAMNPNPLGSQ